MGLGISAQRWLGLDAPCRMPRTTVRDYSQRAQAAGLNSFAAIEPESEGALEARHVLSPRAPSLRDPIQGTTSLT